MVDLVLCAVDDSEAATRVLRHGVGLAAAMQARLLVLHAGDQAEAALRARLASVTPYGALYEGDAEVRAVNGAAVEVILRAAEEARAGLIVAGTRARKGLACALFGSTSAAVLQRTNTPSLFIPPSDTDIIELGFDRVGLRFGTVLAAVDLEEKNRAQLAWASHFAWLARQPLQLLTVVRDDGPSNHDAAAALRKRAEGLTPAAPRAFIVRRGAVPEEIAHCALAEQAGLVVMGLRREHRGTPGRIASEVLQRQDALVLAVPGE